MRSQKIKVYFNKYGRWLWKGKFHLLSLFSTMVTILYLVGLLNFYPKTVGFLFVIIGLLIIYFQLLRDVRNFSYQSPNTFWNWLKSIPAKESNRTTLKTADTVALTDGVRAKITISDDATIERKVSFLMEEIVRVQSSVEKIDNRVNDIDNNFKRELRKLRSEIEHYNEKVKGLIAGHAVGDFGVSLFGIVITFCGMVIEFFIA